MKRTETDIVEDIYETRSRRLVNGTKTKSTNSKPRQKKCRAQKNQLITKYFTTENVKSTLNDLTSVQDDDTAKNPNIDLKDSSKTNCNRLCVTNDVEKTVNASSDCIKKNIFINDVTPKKPEATNKTKKSITPHRILCPSPDDEADFNIGFEIPVGLRNKGAIRKTSRNTEINTFPKENKKVLHLTANPTAKQNSKNNDASLEDCNTKLTKFFPIRRSARKTKKEVEQETLKKYELAIINMIEDGLMIKDFDTKGRGVVATQFFAKGDFVIEYVGELISIAEANKREEKYAELQAGCYMYYFKHNGQQYCIDATEESGKLGRLINHSRNGNLITKTLAIDKKPHLILIAKNDIMPGEELTYDYGDRSKASLQHHPWLAF